MEKPAFIIIGLTGKKQSGKSTTARYLVDNFGFREYSLAEPLKEVCSILFGFNDRQLNGDLKDEIDEKWGITPRSTLQYIGTELFRNNIYKLLPTMNDGFWVNVLSQKILKDIEESSIRKIVISDVRFVNEEKFIHKLGGVIIKIVRPNNKKEEDNHSSENNFNLIKSDFEVKNDRSIHCLQNDILNILCGFVTVKVSD